MRPLTHAHVFTLLVPWPSNKVWDWRHSNELRPTDLSSVHVLLCSRYFKNCLTFSFHIADIYSSWHYLNLIRSRWWLAEYCCHGNLLSNIACVHDISKTVQDLAFILHRSSPHTTQKAADLEYQPLVVLARNAEYKLKLQTTWKYIICCSVGLTTKNRQIIFCIWCLLNPEVEVHSRAEKLCKELMHWQWTEEKQVSMRQTNKNIADR